MSAGVSMRATRRRFDLIPASAGVSERATGRHFVRLDLPANDIIPYARVPRPAAPRPFQPTQAHG